MYESPIQVLQTQMQMELDGDILKAVQKVGVNVDKEELLRSLAYDREQYEKGYSDGVHEVCVRILERLEKYNDANERCRKVAMDRHDYESVAYFQNLIFAIEEAIAFVREEMS